MPHTLGSLSDYDIVLAISEEAINRQLQVLYNHKIEGDDLPPPTEVEGCAPAAQAEYLINHKLSIHVKDDEGNLDTDAGIEAHIECPTVSFTDIATKPNDFHTASLTFKFTTDETASEENSVLNYWSGHGRSAKIKSQIINGWSMSWEVHLGRNDIQDIMEELIKPANSTESNTVLQPAVKEQLTELHVDSKDFLVSSIFCLFNSLQIANTFILRDDKGGLLGVDSVAGSFMLLVTKYFTGLKGGVGAPTPDNPFVLGYGVTQTLPSLQDIDPNLRTDNTPPYFVPKRFQLTTTPGTIQSNGTQFTKGTLNYCLLTHREWADAAHTVEKPGRETNPEKDPSAGVFDQTFFDVTKTSEHDGVMGFAQDLIGGRYITGTFAPLLFIDPVSAFRPLFAEYSDGGFSEYSDNTNQAATTFRRVVNWHLKDMDAGDQALWKSKKWGKGTSQLSISYDSDLLRDPNRVTASDASRRTYITADIFSTIQIMYETAPKMLGPAGNSWSEARDARLTMRYHIVFVLQAGQAGTWSVTIDEAASVMPKFTNDNPPLLIAEDGEDNGRLGTFKQTAEHNLFKAFGTKEELERLMASVRMFGSGSVNNLVAGLKGLMDGLKTTVIMPAGDAFMFTGVDTDAQGNLYSHVNYATPSGGDQVHGK